jgi:hypothetical protein
MVLAIACDGGIVASSVEISQSDVMAIDASWSSANIRVFGLGLGQPRAEAIVEVRRFGGMLVDRDASESSGPRTNVCAAQFCDLQFAADDYGGLSVAFDEVGKISAVSIDWDPEYSESSDPGARIVGPLGQLLPSYSDRLRLRLLGKADRETRIPANGGDSVTYYYDARGISLWVQRQATERKADKGFASVVLSFYAPQSSDLVSPR